MVKNQVDAYLSSHRNAEPQQKGQAMSKRAIVVVDIQNDYFPGGKYELVGIDKAAANAARVIEAAREKGDRVIHVQHIFPTQDAPFFTPDSEGIEINPAVAPREGETVVIKTELKEILDADGIEEVVVVGAMSHMCIDATTRAASDYGYKTTVVQDACATRDLEHEGVTVPAASVHAAMMSALGFAYATITDTNAYTMT